MDRRGDPRVRSRKLNAAASAAGRVLTYLASQLPYTYVHLVSLVVHVYLFTLATWFGFVMSSGLNKLELGVVERGAADASERFEVAEKGTSLASDALTPVRVVFRLLQRAVPGASQHARAARQPLRPSPG